LTYHAAVSVGITHEGAPVFEMLGLIGGEGHLSDVGNHIFVREIVINELRFVGCVKDVQEFRSLPHGVSAQNEVLFILSPVDITHREVVVLWHL